MPPLILFIWAIVTTLAFLGVAVAQMMMPDIDSFKMHSKLSQMMMPDIDFKKLHSKLSKNIHTDYTADGKSQLVTLKSGVAFQGTEDQHGISSFRGIRYGKAPVGNLRWAPPEMYSYDASSSTPIDASNFGDICVQSSGGKEDCLYLNVFVNLKTTSQNKESGSGVPVAVFVHGGSYKSGASNLYPGESLVDYWNGEGIMVTINYRLNVFGFAGSDALRVQDKTDGSTGNYGIQDQRLAFQWVKENIAAFGGDPSRVMIFGESAGAGSMAIHLTNKKSWGLFSSVILESGANSQWVMQPMKLAESTYQLLLQATSCTDVACLLAMDASALFAASQNVDTPMSHYLKNWSPVADGVEATTHPWISVQQGHVADVPMLHGANLDEGAMFCPLDKYTASEMQVYIMWMYADQMLSPTKMMSLYMDDVKYPSAKTGYTDSWYAAERSIGDIFIACPGKFTADTVSTQYSQGTLKAAKTFFYHFEHIPLFMKDKDAVYVNHGDELPYVLHLLQMMQNEGSPLDRRSRDTFSDFTTADLMATYWGNFLISHDPNKESGFGMRLSDNNIRPWGQYAANNGSAHAIREGTRAGVYSLADFRKAQCDYLIPNIDADIKKDFGTA